jgi:hypothetical protein
MKKCKSCQTEIDSKAKKCPHCQADQRNWFVKHKIITVILVLVLIGVISGGAKGNNTTTNSSTSSNKTTNTNTPKPNPIIVKTDTLIDALKENELNASNTYKDKYVELTGKLSVIDSSGKYIGLSPINDDYSLRTVMCYVTQEQKDIVAGLKKDSLVTVIGTITDVGEVMGYSMKVESFK